MRHSALALGLLLALSGPAVAQDPLGKFLPRKEGATACFSRVYDSAHLAKHKDQTVAQIGFNIAYVVVRDEQYGEGAKYYAYELRVRRRGDGPELIAQGNCENRGSRISCYVECDGGNIYLRPRGERSIVLEFGDSDGILMNSGCSDDESTDVLRPGKDDKSFRLDRLPASHCPAFGLW